MNKQPMYIKGDFALIAKYNRFDQSVGIGDLNNPSDGWVDYDPFRNNIIQRSGTCTGVV